MTESETPPPFSALQLMPQVFIDTVERLFFWWEDSCLFDGYDRDPHGLVVNVGLV